MLSRQGERDFALILTNSKKRAQVITFTAQVKTLRISGRITSHRLIRVGIHNGEPHEVEIQHIFQEVRSVMGNCKLFYHFLQPMGDVQACV